MTRKEILERYVDTHVPGHTGYAYQAATWCIDCGQIIARRIVRKLTREQLKAVDHNWLSDTENFPFPISFEPCDYCDHCGAIED